MGESCADCSKWTKDIYWTHFQFTHFFQNLPSGFDQKLILPKKFTASLKRKLHTPSLVVLKGPSGATWTVELTSNEDHMYFKHGWPEFVKDHSLAENDLLIFRYNGQSQFDVLIFDGKNFCEREASYFVKKCDHKEFNTVYVTKKKSRGHLSEEIQTTPNNVVGSPSENHEDDDSLMEFSGDEFVPRSTDKKVRREISSAEPLPSKRPKRSIGSAGKITPISDATPISTKKNSSYAEEYISNRRAVTEEEKNNALKLAEAASSEEGFRIIMRPSHVYKRFFLSIPTGWVSKNLSLQTQDIFLRVGDQTWLTKFTYNSSRRSGGLTCGWKSFAIDNNLEEFDVCVFEPSSPTDSLLLDVKIFRVLPEVIPPTVLSASAKKNSRKLIKDT